MTDPADNPALDRPTIGVCPSCGMGLYADQVGCSLCGWGGERDEANAAPSELPVYQESDHHGHGDLEVTYSFGSLIFFVTLACICLGVVRIAPVPGILLAAVLLPAMARTEALLRKDRREGLKMYWGDQAPYFFDSVLLACGCWIAGGIAAVFTIGVAALVFNLIYTVAPANGKKVELAVFYGSIGVGLIVAAVLFVHYWPRRKGITRRGRRRTGRWR